MPKGHDCSSTGDELAVLVCGFDVYAAWVSSLPRYPGESSWVARGAWFVSLMVSTLSNSVQQRALVEDGTSNNLSFALPGCAPAATLRPDRLADDSAHSIQG